MIATEFYEGQGLGNQLWAYVVTRLIAVHKGVDFAIMSPHRFKGQGFMTIDFGVELDGTGEVPNPILPDGITNYHKEKCELFGTDTGGIDHELFDIPDNAKIDGNFQSYSYIRGKEDLVRSWFSFSANEKTDKDTCVIHFRAGDYKGITDVFLKRSYYQRAMARVEEFNPNIKFVCVSDEPDYARQFLGVEVIGAIEDDVYRAPHHLGGDIGIDFSYLVNAKYLIIPNSSFGWWAAFLNTTKDIVIAPEFWAGWKQRTWKTGDIKTDGFIYESN